MQLYLTEMHTNKTQNQGYLIETGLVIMAMGIWGSNAALFLSNLRELPH